MSRHPLAEIYVKTLISIEDNGRLVPATKATLVRSGTVHVITAWNPGDERPTRDQNNTANQHLHQVLVDQGLNPCHAIGADPNSEHHEESWAVTGLNDQQAKAVGAAFGQVAVFRISDGTQTVLACTGDWSLSRPL